MSHLQPQSPGGSNGWGYSFRSFEQNEAFGGILLLVGIPPQQRESDDR
ncbi:MAG: hypothetical protein M3457_08185 [Chloroflexota bacterium]|nr:hypothetical protein [Chloroflexota bacterium]